MSSALTQKSTKTKSYTWMCLNEGLFCYLSRESKLPTIQCRNCYSCTFVTQTRNRSKEQRTNELHSWSSLTYFWNQQNATRWCSVLTWTTADSDPLKWYPSTTLYNWTTQYFEHGHTMVTATQPTQHNTPCKTGAKENSRCLAVLVRMRSWTKGAHLLNRLNTASRVRHSRIPRKRENYIQKCFQPFYDNYNISYVLTLKVGQIDRPRIAAPRKKYFWLY